MFGFFKQAAQKHNQLNEDQSFYQKIPKLNFNLSGSLVECSQFVYKMRYYSGDYRVINGAEAAHFMCYYAGLVSQPSRLVL